MPQTADNVSFLGVNMDRRLDWGERIEHITTKIFQDCYALKVISEEEDSKTAFSAYYAQEMWFKHDYYSLKEVIEN